jgi:putative oxidoreductase
VLQRDRKSCPQRSTARVARLGRLSSKKCIELHELKDPTMQNLDTALAAGGRLLIAALFLLSGIGKISTPAMTQGYIASAGLPAPLLAYLIAIIIEVGDGLILIVGFRTRIVALILAAFSLAAALVFHNKLADPNEMIHFFKDIAILGGLLQVAAFCPGSVSLDARRLILAR